MHVLRMAVAVAAILCGCRLFRFRCLRRWVRQRCSAHAAEAVLGAVVVPAMGTADVHGFKHSLPFGWQKGCCRWQLLCPAGGVFRKSASNLPLRVRRER